MKVCCSNRQSSLLIFNPTCLCANTLLPVLSPYLLIFMPHPNLLVLVSAMIIICLSGPRKNVIAIMSTHNCIVRHDKGCHRACLGQDIVGCTIAQPTQNLFDYQSKQACMCCTICQRVQPSTQIRHADTCLQLITHHLILCRQAKRCSAAEL